MRGGDVGRGSPPAPWRGCASATFDLTIPGLEPTALPADAASAPTPTPTAPLPTEPATVVASETPTPIPTATPTAPSPACAGSCDGDRAVTISELIRAVNIALANAPLSECVSADTNGDGSVAINELIQAVNSALSGCA